MKKINKIFSTITGSIIILLLIGIGGTYLSDYLVSINWFGDYNQTIYNHYYERDVTIRIWGARHYWYNWGVFLLFTTSVIRAIAGILSICEE